MPKKKIEDSEERLTDKEIGELLGPIPGEVKEPELSIEKPKEIKPKKRPKVVLPVRKLEKPKRYHNQPDWNYLLKAYYEKPENPDFIKYGYVAKVVKRGGNTFVEWNGRLTQV
jgi:hypothetical protein